MKKLILNYPLAFFGILSLISLFGVLSLSAVKVSALSGSNFNPGRIIDDSVFKNETAMSPSQIQSFLNSKVPVCDTDGSEPYAGTTRSAYGASRGNPAPYICLKDYTENVRAVSSSEGYCSGSTTSGTKSAAQIIYDVARACDINPQVLLVMLQKEQSLITDDWPWDRQYEIAMGYGCPDTAPCDEDYYGFFNQVWQAANAFERYAANPTWYNYRAGRNNNVYYHPDLSRCGSSSVFIENQPTAGLYIYTPYQPNQAALNNLYGTGDSCSSYGNRNFWRMFNDWFGTTEGTPFFKVEGDNRTYILGSNNNYYHIDTYEKLYAYGYEKRFNGIAAYSNNYLQGRAFSGVLPIYARFEESHVYLIDRAGRYYFNSRTLLEDTYGYTMGEEALLPNYLKFYLPEAGNVRTIIQQYNGEEVYLMENGKRRRFVDNDAYKSGNPKYSSLPFVRLSFDYMKNLPASFPVLAPNKSIQTYDEGSYSFWDGTNLTNISRSTYNKFITYVDYRLSSYEISNLPRASKPVFALAVGDSNNYFILGEKNKVQIAASQLGTYGFSPEDFAYIPDEFLIRQRTLPLSRIVMLNNSSKKYLIEDGQLKHIDSFNAVRELGLDYSKLLVLPASVISDIPISTDRVYETGTAFKISGQPHTYIINSPNSKLYINDSRLLLDYGITSIRSVSASSVSQYSTVANLTNIVSDSSNNAWLVHSNGNVQHIPPSLVSSNRMSIDIPNIPRVSARIINTRTNVGPLKNLVRDSSNNRVYYIENGLKRHVMSPEAISSLGYTYSDISLVSSYFIDSIPSGATIN